jgi:eukaryotic-like serine/threonine-protein kinase
MNNAVDGRYEIRNLIGRGGMGEVYRAYDKHLGVERAIKLVRQVSEKGSHIPGAEDKRQACIIRLRREAEATAKLAPNSNVVLVYDFVPAHNDTPDYIVMELLEGQLLSQILKKHRRLKPSEAVSLMKDICAGVGAAHKRKIVHRDLNARNVMICQTHHGPSAKVIDFGLAKLPSDSDEMWTVITTTGEFMGTPAYAPPNSGLIRQMLILGRTFIVWASCSMSY